MASHTQEVPEQFNSTFPMLIRPAQHQGEEMPNNALKRTRKRLAQIPRNCSLGYIIARRLAPGP